MINAFREYNMHANAYQQTQLKFIDKNISRYPVFEEILGFQLHIVHLVKTKIAEEAFYSSFHETPDEIIAETINLDLCTHNNDSLYSALRPLEQGITAVYEAIIRAVFESIPKIFYLMKHPEDSRIIQLKEEYRMWCLDYAFEARADSREIPKSNILIKEFIESEHGRKIVDSSRITFDKFFYDNFRKKHTNLWFRNQIYADERLEMQHSIHSILSTSAHANTNRSRLVEKSEPGTRSDAMRLLTELSFFNLFLIINSQKRILVKIDKYGECVDFIKKKDKELGHRFVGTSLYPSHKEYLNNLDIKPNT